MKWPTRAVDFPGLVPMSEGYMTDPEVAAIAWACVCTRRADVYGGVLEVGAYKGRTTSALMLACDTPGDVVVVDTFTGGKDLPDEDVFDAFRRNLVLAHSVAALDGVEVIRGDSRVVLPELRSVGRRFRVELIDGDHSEEGAFADLCNAWEMLSPGGFLFVDDANFTEVGHAIERWLKSDGSAVVRVDAWMGSVTSKLAYFRKVAPGGAT